MPADGVVILAATSAGDADFSGAGGSAGSYLLTISPEAYAVSVSGRVVDGKTGVPLPSGPRTTTGSGPSCAGAARRQAVGARKPWAGRTRMPTGCSCSHPPRTNRSQPDATRSLPAQTMTLGTSYGEGRSDIFTLGENEAKAIGDIPLGPPCASAPSPASHPRPRWTAT